MSGVYWRRVEILRGDLASRHNSLWRARLARPPSRTLLAVAVLGSATAVVAIKYERKIRVWAERQDAPASSPSGSPSQYL